MINLDEMYMRKALSEARVGGQKDEVPVGAIIIKNREIIAKAHNLCICLCDPTAHAEMQAITSACSFLGSRYLTECTMYSTLEPCIMCAGALYWSQIGRLVYGASDKKLGGFSRKTQLIHPKTKITSGVLEYECGEIISAFFKKKRNFK